VSHRERKSLKKPNRRDPINPATGLPWRYCAPCELRVVSATKQKTKARNGQRAAERRVPQIRISGKWLEHLGFTEGTSFLVLADVPNQILLALTAP
jgi:hypothetical protein